MVREARRSALSAAVFESRSPAEVFRVFYYLETKQNKESKVCCMAAVFIKSF